MHLPRVLAVSGVIALLAGASPSALAATGGTAVSAGTWTATKAPLPANADHTYAQLTSVACPSASKCIAAGSYTGSAGKQGLLLTKSSTGWTAAQAPVPADAAADPYATLDSINCFSALVCAAFGEYTDSSGNIQWELLTTSGASWKAAKAPVPPSWDGYLYLSAVHCASATSCLAVGSYGDSADNLQGLLITGFGKHWTATQAPVPPNASTDPVVNLNAVTCTGSTGSCVVVGTYIADPVNHYQEGLLLTGSGSSWTATEAPVPANAATRPWPHLTAVRCMSPSSCTAVGTYDDASSDGYGLLVTGSGTSWRATESPEPPNASGAFSWLSAVTCPGTSACIAAGGYNIAGGGDTPMLVMVSGSSLAVSQAPMPGNAAQYSSPDLGAVACASASACVTVGRYRTVSKPYRGLLVYGGGTSWTAIQAPVPNNSGVNTDIPAVSCPKKSSTCIAVGYYKKSGSDQGLLLTGPA